MKLILYIEILFMRGDFCVTRANYSTRLMVRCAKMYYEDNMNQDEISEILQVSKSTVSRILAAARNKGIVKIIVDNPLKDDYIQLEKEIESKFGLKEVIIVDSGNDAKETKRNLGKAAAEYIQRIMKDGQIIGVTWGTTLKEIPQFVENDRKRKVTFIPMLGGIGEAEIDIHPNQIALQLAKKFNAESKLLHAPYQVDSMERKESLISDKNIWEFFKLFDNIHVALIGIGSPLLNTSTLVESGYYTMEDIKMLVRQGAVADISSLFIDKDGNGDKFEFNNRVVGIDLERIKKIPLTIGIAGSIEKRDAILAAIRGNYIRVLIVDEVAARSMLKEN